VAAAFSHLRIRTFQQRGKGKGDAVRLGFSEAHGEVLMILDADLSVPPEALPKFYRAIADGSGELISSAVVWSTRWRTGRCGLQT